ncbi:hypothetical protein CT0861_07421 [Colletotrichum tofieldiae]|uniref:Cellulose-binding protein n=1 Tax=Colletotrichum tofieldiae TaxID=708197 RepID=A0A166TY17_9PEZI|nr:hypothetical protein CT0861_07421 [Colletotrichum tofieldiae]
MPRVFLLSDIGNEPDDAQSLVRILTQPFEKLSSSGLPVYGMDGVGDGKDSEGSKRLVKAVDASDEPLWVPTISDQDNTGSWIRRNRPQLFYIASVHHFNRYALAAWGGISGDEYYNFPSFSNLDVVSPEWIQENIQSVGALGAKYPDADFIVEGDTPALLYLIPNGLSDPEHPEWGSWGGRYGPVTYGEGHYADSVDAIKGVSGRTIMSSQATVWRWREAFQNDFAARLKWSASSKFHDAPHAPVVVLNGDRSRKVVKMVVGEEEQYLEPSSNNNNPGRGVGRLELSDANAPIIAVTMPSKESLRAPGRNRRPDDDKHMHLILEVSDGTLVSYRRVVFTILGPAANDKTATDGKKPQETVHDEFSSTLEDRLG